MSPTYASWVAMKSRCRNPNIPGFKEYGAKGIDYPQEWERFEQFLADMGARPPSTSLDRVDGTKGYSPGNCRWATQSVQCRNQRTNRHVVFEGREWVMAELAEELGLRWDTLSYRLKRGWTEDQIRNTPATRGNCLKVTKGWHERVPWNKGITWSKGK